MRCARLMRAILRKLSRSFAPGAPLFSGWNCTPKIFAVSRTAVNSRPCSQVGGAFPGRLAGAA